MNNTQWLMGWWVGITLAWTMPEAPAQGTRADYDRAKAARERSMGGFGDANPARGLRLVP